MRAKVNRLPLYKLFSFFFCGLLCFGALAAEGKKFKVQVCSLNLAPQTSLNSAGRPDGYAVRILEAVAEQLAWQLKIEYFPWARVAHMAQKGECDIVLTVLMREDYADYMVFPKEPILLQKNVIVVRKDSDLTFAGDIEDFVRRHPIAMYRDKAINDEFQRIRHEPWARIQLTNDSAHSLAMMLLNRVDAVFENDLTAIMELKKLDKLEQAKLLDPPLNVTPAYITFPKAGRLAQSAAAFDDAMVAFKQTEAFKKIQKQYLGAATEE